MITIDLDQLIDALAPRLATELRAQFARGGAGSLRSLIDPGSSAHGESNADQFAPSRRPDEVIDSRGAREFGLTARRFNILAKGGAFPCFRLDARGRVGAYRRDVQTWLEQQKWTAPEAEPPMGEPLLTPKLPPSPQELDQIILRTLESGRLRVIPGRGGTAKPPGPIPPNSRK